MIATKEREVFDERDYFDDCLCEGVEETGSEWDAEVDRRLQQVLNGEVELIPGDAVDREMQELLASIRQKREKGMPV